MRISDMGVLDSLPTHPAPATAASRWVGASIAITKVKTQAFLPDDATRWCERQPGWIVSLQTENRTAVAVSLKILLRLIRPIDAHSDVIRLILAELRELHAELAFGSTYTFFSYLPLL
jgi:hypothetical protein